METNAAERLESALVALRKCQERALTGQFALEVMHEIRNPLDALGNLIHLASESEDLAAAQRYMREANEQITLLHQIAGQTLTVARQTQIPISIHLRELVEAAIRIHHRRITLKRAVMQRDFGQSELVSVHPGEIVQVLSNLLGNALDAIADAGIVTLRIRKRGQQLCLFISDNGHGISADHLGRMFEPFFTTKDGQGNGLGLALSKKLLERHEGTIDVRSCARPARSGTTFRVRLPLLKVA